MNPLKIYLSYPNSITQWSFVLVAFARSVHHGYMNVTVDKTPENERKIKEAGFPTWDDSDRLTGKLYIRVKAEHLSWIIQ